MLIILSGRPGTGKTTIARELAHRLAAIHIRIDSIEQAIRDAGALTGPMNDAGYRVAYAVAEDNLRLGRTVIADSVNPIEITREAWRNVAVRAGTKSINVEIVCSNADEHRRRVESRTPDIAGHQLPTWAEVTARDYDPWSDGRIVIDTAQETVEAAVERIRASLT